jgi:ParB/RepB/Spo0J family partition protein
VTTSFHAALAVATTPAERLSAIMLKGESMRAFATRVGIDHMQVSRVQSGKVVDLSLDTWRSIATVTGLPLALLIGADEPPRPTGPGLRDIPWVLIHPSPLNPRKSFDDDAIAELADSIAASGILQNLIVRPKSGLPDDDTGGYWLIGGERRWRAVQHLIETRRAGMQHPMPCRVIVCDDDQHLRHAIVENLQRQDVPAIEEAEAFAALRLAGWGTDRIAQETGKTRRFVQLRLSLTDKLIEEAKLALTNGAISAEVARVIATVDAAEQKKILRGGTLPRTGQEARERVRVVKGHFAFPASQARFPLASYKGARWVDDQDNEHLLDREEVKRLQTEGAETYAALECARGAWAFAEFSDHIPSYLDKTEDPTKAGCLVTVDWDCRMRVETGIDVDAWTKWKAPIRTVDPDAEARRKREEEAVKVRTEAAETWTAAVQNKLRNGQNTDVGIALLLLGLVTERKDYNKRRLRTQIGAGAAALPFFQAALGKKAVAVDKTYQQVTLTSSISEVDAFRALANELSLSETMNLLSAVAASGLKPPLVRGEAPWVTDEHQLLADMLSVPIPPALRADFDDPLPANAVRQDVAHGDVGVGDDDDDQLDIEDAIGASKEAA